MTARDIGFITKQIAGHGRRDASAPAMVRKIVEVK